MRYRLTLSLAFLCFNWRVQIFNYFRLTRCQRTMDLGWMNMKQPLQNPVSGSLRKLGQTPFRSVMVFPHKVERCEFSYIIFLWLVSSNKRNAKSWGGQIYAIRLNFSVIEALSNVFPFLWSISLLFLGNNIGSCETYPVWETVCYSFGLWLFQF
jgi:hypothetical protein